ncbi:hypothetical protein [Fructobacillus tropaeoli]|uniref:hypothetical protein n=1 Tax=Fructobacillus tropaeoli TaxID=709323 RepID=UPI0019440065|nr:hypothetical protein [Fructobacillus tropaeoli]GIC69795.1 hypothetical protein FT12353_04330 [Fructobacillus tropaeoli]CAK1253596.1 hypothetical protein R55227_BLOPHJLP_01545 [Fructobacillus tropaeoli]
MDILIKLVGVVVSVVVVIGLFSILFGFNKFTKGRKSEDTRMTDEGIEGMIWGAATAAIVGGVGAGIIAALSKISF